MERLRLPSLASLRRGIARRTKSPARRVSSPSGSSRSHDSAPHPIGKDSNKVCPITGLSAGGNPQESAGAASGETYAAMQRDPDIAEERLALEVGTAGGTPDAEEGATPAAQPSPRAVPLSVIDGKHQATPQTRRLVRSVGLESLRAFTSLFYRRSFGDRHIDKFIANRGDPHADRFALWIVEKLGDGTPWTQERRTRPRRQMRLGGEVVDVSFDRSSAHFAAWHSPKREPHRWGEHFRFDDARVWMRLHFWAARETGMFHRHPEFMEYYMRFIGHFISIYSSKAPPFVRESVRWSASPKNVQLYLAAGNVMRDVIDKPIDEALAELPAEERLYTGSRHSDPAWPYDLRPL
uniref:Uncharacterized protein n=1 Tax=Alexandrium catenella TaxID=2925 RepID=A0A7S1M6D7_ALECA|mmetsp:Transcript_19401/g.52812  ORF Transcript_19401/g.52812 Transcript_19401/m.52812 type:complete len:351 (+) Transcript_19401:47-1099(+)